MADSGTGCLPLARLIAVSSTALRTLNSVAPRQTTESLSNFGPLFSSSLSCIAALPVGFFTFLRFAMA